VSCVDVRQRRRRLYVDLSAVVHARTHARGGTTLLCVHVRASTFTGVHTALCVIASKDPGRD